MIGRFVSGPWVTLAMLALSTPAGSIHAQTPPALQSFAEFVGGLTAARADHFVDQPARAAVSGGSDQFVAQPAHAAVSDASEFEAMRRHLLALYQGVTVRHSYVLDHQIFDCVPVLQQPSLRLAGVPQAASPPPVSPGSGRQGVLSLPPGSRDQLGNLQSCQDGEIPMRRVTLDEVTRFRTLREFLRKEPNAAVADNHQYAYEYQEVNNNGGLSVLSLWKPYVDISLSEVFSLCQQWYLGGAAAQLQSAEVGWQNYPQKWGTEDSVLFVYWTADDYVNTGCYNLECPGFVQTNKNLQLGVGFSQYSTDGGPMLELYAGYHFYKGNWWLWVGGAYMGYIKGTSYNGGQLSKSAQQILFGGETVGATEWPPMGSGQFANTRAREAAYQRDIVYWNTADVIFNAKLTAVDASPSCYTTDASGVAIWGTYFFFGGPGGKTC